MPATIPERPRPALPSLWRRLVWFVLLYLAGVLAVGVVAYGLRLWIKPAPRQAVSPTSQSQKSAGIVSAGPVG